MADAEQLASMTAGQRSALLLAAFNGLNQRRPDDDLVGWSHVGTHNNPMVRQPATAFDAVGTCMTNLANSLAEKVQLLVADRVTVKPRST